MVTVKAHPSNGSDIPEALLPPLIMEPINEQGVAHPVLEPVRLGEEAEQPGDVMNALSGFSDLSSALQRQYYEDGIDIPAEDMGGRGGDVVHEDGEDCAGADPA